jgi:DNA-binding NtrC family response regulator
MAMERQGASMDQSERGVLIVSTDLNVLRALSFALSLTGYAVTTATEWFEVTAALRRLPISTALYELKDLDRKEWERLVTLRRNHPELAVVLLASLESGELDRAVDEGLIVGYQVKPVDLYSLETFLENLDGERQRAHA